MAFLSGTRVLDLTDERGLLAGRVLADLGADVVQVEPPGGSSARQRIPRPPSDPATSYVWEAYAANKRGIIADLESPAGQQLVRDLAAVADVVIGGVVRSAAPTFGQHNRVVLAELLGYDDEHIDRLATAGVLR
jgi:crotonobetainyl-CoA:carnitine CoA-transferase CaiB-like acyl-CoA transferase